MNDRQVGERLRILRAWRQLTQAEVATVLGIRQNGVSEIEKGERPLTIARASLLCDSFGVPLAWFFEESVPLTLADTGTAGRAREVRKPRPAARVRGKKSARKGRDLGAETSSRFSGLRLVHSR